MGSWGMGSIPQLRWFLNWTGLGTGGPRRWIFLAVAAVLVLLGQWLRTSVSLTSLENFAWTVVEDFNQIQPFVLIPEFLYRLGGCYVRSGCDWSLLFNPFHYPKTAFYTLRDLLSASSDLAGGVFVLALGVGGATLAELWQRYVKRGSDWHLLDLVALSVILPFAVSVAALVMQLVAIALFGLFGALIGIILFLLGTFGWVFSAYGFLRQVRQTADGIGTIADTVASGAAPPPPPPGEPKT